MNQDILCVYYSRTGKTRAAMEAVAQALDAELVEISDDKIRSGKKGYITCAFDAVRRSSHKLLPFTTRRRLEEYRLVILGTPVWAGRCSAVMRSFLKSNGYKIVDAAYVITRSTETRHEEIYEQMDRYLAQRRVRAVSLRPGDAGYTFWLNQFIQGVQADFLSQGQA